MKSKTKGGNTAAILLVKGYEIIVDKEDLERVAELTWTPSIKGKHVYFTKNVVDLRIDNKSGYRNVSFDKNRRKWVARMAINGVYKFLGRYDTAEEAAEVIRLKNLEVYGYER